MLTSMSLEWLCAIDLSELLDGIHGFDLINLVEWNSLYHWMKKQVCAASKCIILLSSL